MRKFEKITLIRETGVIGIMRTTSSQSLIDATEALSKGGVKVIEVTMTTPEAVGVIKDAKQKYQDDILFGAGTVLDCETARMAIIAGADFIVSPTLDVEMIALCNRYGIPVVPGCFTPSEMLCAWEAGADFIKLFPANILGPKMFKAVLAPLPQLEIMAVGGVNLENAGDFIKNGAVALGVGSCLVNQKLLDEGAFSELTDRAEKIILKVKESRQR